MTDRRNWDSFWNGLTTESEIQMRDFYGGRQWVLKHTPRFGKVLEAGCGLGRYVFYLSRLGIDIDGVDSCKTTVERARGWASRNGFKCNLRLGDVTDLPYEANSISGYISLGVVEHFAEGPQRAIREAYRVLRPGGIAIITTPSDSFSQVYLRSRRKLRDTVKRLLGKAVAKRQFFQHWYKPQQLVSFVEESGLKVVLSGGGDLIYSMWELGVLPKDNSIFRLLTRLENTPLSQFGAQSFTVSVKEAPEMFCFLCGVQKVEPRGLRQFYLPICESCACRDVAEHYRPRIKPRFHSRWEFQPQLQRSRPETCGYCGEEFTTDELFEDFGFSIPVCNGCVRKPEINIELSNRFLKPVWRMAGRGERG